LSERRSKDTRERLPAVSVPSLADTVAQILRKRILDGEFRNGERLVEAVLAREMRISRGPVREALMTLRAEGLVAEDQPRGVRVTDLGLDDISEIFDLRIAVEGRAAQRLALSNVDLGPLRAILARLVAAVEKDAVDTVIDLDLEFHATLCRLSGNRRLHQVFVQHVPVLETVFRLDPSLFGTGVARMGERHEAIVAAIERRDPSAALAAIEVHMTIAEERFANCLRRMRPR
jgi:DNA-binding GntR family transcriptional regulator